MKSFSKKSSEIEKKLQEISAISYSREYFQSETDLETFERFKKGGRPGAVFVQALKCVPKDISGPFLDIGSGRGEMVIHLVRLGKKAYGIDYSQAAISIAQGILKREKKSVRALADFRLADCTRIPFKNNSFQCLFLLDIVEHLTPRQLKLALKEANRVLKEGGVLIIHTNNKYFEKFTKFLIAIFYHGIKVLLNPKKIMERMPSSPYEHLHINYLTGDKLLRYLEECGFNAKIEYIRPRKKAEIQEYVPYNQGWKKAIFHNLAWILLNSPLLKFISPAVWIIARKR